MPLPDVPATEAAIVAQTNAYRASQKLAPVAPNAQLAAAARAYGALLARTHAFSHDADGRQPGDRATAAGYTPCQISENLALNLDSRGFDAAKLSRLAVDGWIASPGHRRNMVAPHVTDIGVAVVRAPDKNPKYLSVQLFGRPIKLRYSFKIENRTGGGVSYELDSRSYDIAANMVVTHSACAPHHATFKGVKGAYTTRDGQAFTLTTAADGGLFVKVTPLAAGKQSSAPVRAP